MKKNVSLWVSKERPTDAQRSETQDYHGVTKIIEECLFYNLASERNKNG